MRALNFGLFQSDKGKNLKFFLPLDQEKTRASSGNVVPEYTLNDRAMLYINETSDRIDWITSWCVETGPLKANTAYNDCINLFFRDETPDGVIHVLAINIRAELAKPKYVVMEASHE